MVRGSLNSTRSFVMACVYQAIRCALTVEVPNTAGAFRPITVLTKPGTVAEVVMPGASSMRGVTGFRVLDALNGALAQLIPDRVPGRGGGRQHARHLRCRPARNGRAVRLLRARRRYLGRHADVGRQRRAHEPGQPRREHPDRGRRVRVPDRRRALRARARHGWRGRAPGRPRDRARLALSDAGDVADRALGSCRPAAVRPRRRRQRRAVEQPPAAPGRDARRCCPRCSRRRSETGDVYVHRMAGGGGWGDPLARDPAAVAARRARTRR